MKDWHALYLRYLPDFGRWKSNLPLFTKMSNFKFPDFYVTKYPGLPAFPLNWRDETSGVLPSAVFAYLEDKATAEQLKLVAAYIEYYIQAPVWDIEDNAFEEELKALRESSKNLKTRQEIHDWIFQAMKIGLDLF